MYNGNDGDSQVAMSLSRTRRVLAGGKLPMRRIAGPSNEITQGNQ
jgi:hypothetical protein